MNLDCRVGDPLGSNKCIASNKCLKVVTKKLLMGGKSPWWEVPKLFRGPWSMTHARAVGLLLGPLQQQRPGLHGDD